MTKNKFIFFMISVIFVFLLQSQEIRARNAEAKIPSNSSTTFSNPFRMSSWLSYPSQILQYWFPLFRPAFYPTYLLKPSTAKPPTENATEKTDAKSKPKTENIFGISGPPGDDVGCLSPGEIEW